jgi:hypothetical protein
MLFLLPTVFCVDVFSKYDGETATIFDVKLIPGTHDSGLLGITQIATIQQQLDMGIRYFDLKVSPNARESITLSARVEVGPDFEANFEQMEEISRCDLDGKFFICYHSKERLADVLASFKTFLSENPGEIIFPYIRTDPDTDGTQYKHTVERIIESVGGYLSPDISLFGEPAIFVNKPLNQLKGQMVLLHEHDYCFKDSNGICMSWFIYDNLEITGLSVLKASSSRYSHLPTELKGYASKIESFNRIHEHLTRFPQLHQRQDNGLVTAQVLMLDKSEFPKLRKDICEEYNQQLLAELTQLKDQGKQVNLGVVGIDGAHQGLIEALLALTD